MAIWRESSKRVPFRNATERNAESVTFIATSTYGIQQREYCYEEGSSRGAVGFSASKCQFELTSNAESLSAFLRFLADFRDFLPFGSRSSGCLSGYRDDEPVPFGPQNRHVWRDKSGLSVVSRESLHSS